MKDYFATICECDNINLKISYIRTDFFGDIYTTQKSETSENK